MDDKLLPAIQKAYDLNRWLLPCVAKFRRDYKFTLGDRILGAALDLQGALIESGHAKAKERTAVSRQPPARSAAAAASSGARRRSAHQSTAPVCRRTRFGARSHDRWLAALGWLVA